MSKEREDIRIRIAGVYIENNKILLVKHRKHNREYYLLPGGGQHTGEKAADALVREWKEELSLDIVPGEFLFFGESIPPDIDMKKHVYQIVFSVLEISGEICLQPDDTLIGQAWVDIKELPNLILFPLCIDQLMNCIPDIQKSQPSYRAYIWA